MTPSRSLRTLHTDNQAEVTGLPLMLLILVVIAGVGLAVILAWTGKIGGGPDTIGSITLVNAEENGVSLSKIEIGEDAATSGACTPQSLYALVGAPGGGTITEAAVTISGAVQRSVVGVSGDTGAAELEDVVFTLPPQQMTGEVRLKAEKSGFTPFETTLLVVRASSDNCG